MKESTLVDAPYVNEFSLILECRLVKVVELGLHTQFIGEILDVKADDAVLDDKKRLPDIEKVNSSFLALSKMHIIRSEALGVVSEKLSP
jgi:flavin reductase (DIM6/NTAB) family NADH-FMN oxidoreductase RutF